MKENSTTRRLVIGSALFMLVLVASATAALVIDLDGSANVARTTQQAIQSARDNGEFSASLVAALNRSDNYAEFGRADDRDAARAELDRAASLQGRLDGAISGRAGDLLARVSGAVDGVISAVDAGARGEVPARLNDLVAAGRDLDAYRQFADQHIAQEAAATDRLIDDVSQRSLWASIAGIVVLAGMSILSIYLLRRNILQPLDELSLAAAEVAAGKLDRKIRQTTQDEIGRLQVAFNSMVGDLRRGKELLEERNNLLQQNLAFREQAQARLATLATIVESSRDAIVSYTVDGTVLSWNSSAEQLYGFRASEMIGQPLAKAIPAERAEQFEAQRRRVLKGERVDDWEITRPRPDGSGMEDLWVTLDPICDEEGNVVAIASIARDVTERRKIDRMKNEFISTVSHELRTPLTSIRGSLGLIAGGVAGEVSPQARMMIDIAHSNSERLVRLINDILDIEKIESGKMEFNLKPQELMPLIDAALRSNAGYGAEYGVEFVLADTLPGAQVRVDVDRFAQVLANLLSNAAKFSPRGAQVVVSATRHDGQIRVAVTDRGSGIPAEFQGRIFQKFAQADSSNTRQKGGTGLGLSIVKAIVERFGGSIDFDTAPGAGTTFYFDLPEWHDPAPRPAKWTPGEAEDERVLICEDDADIATLLGMILAEAGFAADVASSATQAKALLAQRRYTAMTLDLLLPGEDGLDLIRELREQESTRALPIVVVSAVASAGRRELNGGALSVIDWLDKPIDQERLASSVLSAVRHRPSGEHKVRILHVEDDRDVSQVVATMLQDIAETDMATSLSAARQKIAARDYDLLILDLSLPDGSGLDLLGELDGPHGPRIPVVLFSGREVTAETARHVAAALVKTRTSEEQLINTITALVSGEPAPQAALTR